ncbi:hypothetical protein H6G33_11815 [Calothrix sp. FACHB-1219]|uniref:hypothetical protein n=1 Tax=unclassified Calothrix TaxID=2619626 RepID=UPI00168737B8|nr:MULTISPECIES: hypothetical protein [unclassified Calothrix]MBD2202312.1 hypothetical protein [Calothrix sp. FACHB-168]MBD2217718.1 hypothetical protein [Calothrix sp. FACHB-1219]
MHKVVADSDRVTILKQLSAFADRCAIAQQISATLPKRVTSPLHNFTFLHVLI